MTRTHEEATTWATEHGYTDAAPTPYAGPVKAGQRFRLSTGRLGEVMGVSQGSASVSWNDERGGYVYGSFYRPGAYSVSYRSINPKTGEPWQGSKSTTPEKVTANLV